MRDIIKNRSMQNQQTKNLSRGRKMKPDQQKKGKTDQPSETREASQHRASKQEKEGKSGCEVHREDRGGRLSKIDEARTDWLIDYLIDYVKKILCKRMTAKIQPAKLFILNSYASQMLPGTSSIAFVLSGCVGPDRSRGSVMAPGIHTWDVL